MFLFPKASLASPKRSVTSVADPSVGTFVLSDPEILGVEAMDLETVTIRVVVPTQTLKQAELARAVRARIRTALEAPAHRTSTA